MKKKGIILLSILIGLLVLSGIILWVYPNFAPLTIKKDIINHFGYTIHKDHVVLDKYYGNEKEVVIPDTLWGNPVMVIGRSCFKKNETLEKVVFPSELEVIESDAFHDCSALKEVQGGEKVRLIGISAFAECYKLENIGGLGQGVEEIGSEAFCDCKSLTYFPFTENLRMVWSGSFWDAGIELVDEVDSVEYMEEHVFTGTPWMEKQEEDFVIYNDILIEYKGNEKIVVIPEGVGIAVKFKDTEGIEEIYIPSSAKYVLSGSLLLCDGIRMYIPKEVEKIGYTVLYDGTVELQSLDYSENGSDNIIVTTAGSPAEAYAKEFGFECEIVEGW